MRRERTQQGDGRPGLPARLTPFLIPLFFAATAMVFTWRAVVEVRLGTVVRPGPGAWPIIVAAVLLAVSVWLIRQAARQRPGDADDAPASLGPPALILAACVFAAMALEPLGYRLTTLLILVFFLGIVERRSLVSTGIVAVAVSFGSYAVLSGLLRLRLPIGLLGI